MVGRRNKVRKKVAAAARGSMAGKSYVVRLLHQILAEIWGVTKLQGCFAGLLVAMAYAYQFFFGAGLSTEDAISLLVPLLWFCCLAGSILVVNAAKNIREEDILAWEADRPMIIGADKSPKPAIRHLVIPTGAILVFLGAVFVTSIVQVSKRPRVSAEVGAPSLSIRSVVTPSNPDRAAAFGVKWRAEYRSLSLRVNNVSEYPVHDLDLTVGVLDGSGDTLHGMGQISKIPGCEFHGPTLPELELRIRGTDGQDYVFSSRDNPLELPYGDQWKVFCPTLPAGLELRLMLIASSNDQTAAPKKLRTLGSYEASTGDGNNIVKFDKLVDVFR